MRRHTPPDEPAMVLENDQRVDGNQSAARSEVALTPHRPPPYYRTDSTGGSGGRRVLTHERADVEGVLFDPNALIEEDENVNGEQRFVSIGLDPLGRLLVVIYIFRGDDIRLISARRATRRERRAYEA